MKYFIFSLLSIILLLQCRSKEVTQAQRIIDFAIKKHGGDNYKNMNLSFDFRKYHFDVRHKNGKYQYIRSFLSDDGNKVIDTLNNSGLVRIIDGEKQSLTEKEYASIYGSVNSQVYFVLLPYRLNDPAVNKEYIDLSEVRGEPYHKIKVTFEEEGGGEDFDDVYIYWIHEKNHTMDYLAYEFHVNKGGFRFREGYNFRTVGGIRFADYINFKESDSTTLIQDYDQLWEKEKLIELSKIEIVNIQVTPL